jgi:CelD/BcsL family acetyltransferase involved in cellulose biosynthesis
MSDLTQLEALLAAEDEYKSTSAPLLSKEAEWERVTDEDPGLLAYGPIWSAGYDAAARSTEAAMAALRDEHELSTVTAHSNRVAAYPGCETCDLLRQWAEAKGE